MKFAKTDSRKVDLKHVDWIVSDVYQIVDSDIAESISPCSKVVIHVLKSRIENWKLIINPYGNQKILPRIEIVTGNFAFFD